MSCCGVLSGVRSSGVFGSNRNCFVLRMDVKEKAISAVIPLGYTGLVCFVVSFVFIPVVSLFLYIFLSFGFVTLCTRWDLGVVAIWGFWFGFISEFFVFLSY